MAKAGNKKSTLSKKPSVNSVLKGVKVLELGAFQVGPLAARWLAEAGAEVTKIEGLPVGDPIRGAITRVTRGRSTDSYNWSCEYLNWNKRSVALQLDHPQAREIVYKLVDKCDVFITNLRMPTLKKWGVDYESLAAIKPGIVYGYGTGLGLKGPDSARPGLDMIGQAMSGILSMSGDPEGISMAGGQAPCDKIAALQLAYGIMLALFHSKQTGQGQMVDTSLLGAGLYLASTELQYHMGSGGVTAGIRRKNVSNPLRNIYQTKDNRWIVFNMTQSDRYWPEFCKAVGIENLQHDPKFESMVPRAEHRSELIAILDKVFATRTKDEWEQILSKYSLIEATVKILPEVAVSPQVLENGYVQNFDHPKVGPTKVIGPLVGLSETPLKIGDSAPEMGQHTEEVLLENGYTWDDLAKFKEAGVIL